MNIDVRFIPVGLADSTIEEYYNITGLMLNTPVGSFDVKQISSIQKDQSDWDVGIKLIIMGILAFLSFIPIFFWITFPFLIMCLFFPISHDKTIIYSNGRKYIIYRYKEYLWQLIYRLTKKTPYEDYPKGLLIGQKIYEYVRNEVANCKA
jgi:hypothetical protein